MLERTSRAVMLGLALVGLSASGCAKGGDFEGSGGSGEGGSGGGGNGAGAGTSNGGGGSGGGTGSTSDTSGTTGSTSDTTTTGSTTTSSTTTSSTTTSSTTTSSTTMTDCPAGTHECNGQCVGNTPDTGCLQSVSCAPCAVPANGSAICTAAGACDIMCNAGYMKSGATCVPSGGTCNGDDCQAQCFAGCILMGKFGGIGICNGNTCACMCLDAP